MGYKKTVYLPTMRSSLWADLGLIFLQMSMVNIVLALLNMDVRELIMADSITANRKPRAPAGKWFKIKLPKIEAPSK